MRKYKSGSTTPVRVEYGYDLIEGLRAFTETAPLADVFEPVNDELDAAYENTRSKRKPMLKARAVLRVAGYKVDKGSKILAKSTEVADGGRKGKLYDEMFPKGLSSVVAPSGRGQLEPTKALLERLKISRTEAIEPLRAEWLPRLEELLAELDAAVTNYNKTLDDESAAFRVEKTLREEHETMIDKLMGEVRAEFPRDRATQNAIFPNVSSRTSKSVRDDDEDSEE